jgi:hypothetical protein
LAFANGSSLRAIAAALSGAEPVTQRIGNEVVQDLPKSVPVLPTRIWWPHFGLPSTNTRAWRGTGAPGGLPAFTSHRIVVIR